MKDFIFKLKTAWNAYKTAGDILVAEKAFINQYIDDRNEKAWNDAAPYEAVRIYGENRDISDWIWNRDVMLKTMTSDEVVARANECSTLHPPHQDAVISKPRVVQRKPRATMAKRRKNANKRPAKQR